jgi:hypothetical protein
MGTAIPRTPQEPTRSNTTGLPNRATPDPASRAVLQSWKEIASELDRSVRTVQRWERILKLPVHRLGKGPRCPVFAFKDELHLWLQRTADDVADEFGKVLPFNTRKIPRRVPQAAETGNGDRLAVKPEPEILKSLNAFFALENTRHMPRNCAHCKSPTEFLVGQFWLYGTEKTWQVSLPFCPACDGEICSLLPSPSTHLT